MKKFFICLAMLTFVSTNANSENSILSLAKQNGVQKCLPQLKLTSDFIIDNKTHSTHATWNYKDPDNRLYTSMASKKNIWGDSHVTVTVAPTSSGKCDTFYLETLVLTQSCSSTREEVFSSYKYVGELNQSTLILQSKSKSIHVYLTPQSGSLCLVSRKEIVYQN